MSSIIKLSITLFIYLSLSLVGVCQSAEIKQLASQMEANPNHESVVNTIIDKLRDNNTSFDNRLALQTVLVHKLIALQKWDTCIAYCQQQIQEAHQSKNPPAEAKFYMLLGNTYYNILKKDKSLEYWLKAIEISKKNNIGEVLEHCTHNVGVYYLENSQFGPAEKYLLQSVEQSKKNNTFFAEGGNRHMRLLATLYSLKKEFAKAAALYIQVIDSCRAIKDSDNLREALSFYSELLKNQKKFTPALQASAEAVRIDSLRKTQDMTLTTMRFHAYNLYAAGDYKKAYETMARINDSSQQMYNFSISSKISEAEAKFKNSELRHEKELELLKARKEKQIYLLVFLGLLSTAGFGIYQFYRQKNLKQKIAMQRQVQEEKERLSRDIHDSLGSQMSLLSNNIESLDINYARNQNIDPNISQIKESSKQLLQTLRGTIWILNKEQITVQDFFDKLVDYAHRYLQASSRISLEVEENIEGEKILQGKEVMHLFRIAQEAIANAVKYSQAKKLSLCGNLENNRFTVKVADDGIGFDRQQITGDQHFGLKNMQQRAAEINAVVNIESAPEKGTAVEVTI